MMDLVALCMTSIMIYHVKTKYTAVGRKEIAMFFQLYLVTIFLEMLLVTNIIPTASILYPVRSNILNLASHTENRFFSH